MPILGVKKYQNIFQIYKKYFGVFFYAEAKHTTYIYIYIYIYESSVLPKRFYYIYGYTGGTIKLSP